MHDHDQRFKTLIREFFAEFLQLFFADWAKRLDCSKIEWLDKEMFADAPAGTRSILDLVGKLPARQVPPGADPAQPDTWLALVHIEIESADKVAPLRPRMFRSYVYLRDRHQLPVLPIGIFLNVGLDGIGIDIYEEQFWEMTPVRFQYLYVGLPALDAVQYVEGDNYLGVALSSLMKIPKERIVELGAEALKRLAEASLSDQKRFLLADCFDAYLPVPEDQRGELEKLLTGLKYSGVQAMNKTTYEKGIEKGVEKGAEVGRRQLMREMIEDQFGPLPPSAAERLERLPLADLVPLRKAIRTARSLRDLGLE
jgi:hypothetical protein